MKFKNLILIICMICLVLTPVMAKDFVIRNESSSSDNYFVVNVRCGEVYLNKMEEYFK